MIHIHAELLREEIGSGNERVREHFDHLRDSVGKMEVLIRDLLHYSRTVHGEGLPIGDASLDLSLHEALAVLQYEIAESGAIVTAETLPAVKGDGSQLSHVFQNLISNAIKYRRAGSVPQITIGALRKEQHWIISVGDNGIGFEPQYAERIFGLFKRLHRDAYPGTGLGLAICQRIIERHGGRIWATSTAGQGSIFSFSLLAVERADESGTNA
jgi:light-regulated signal transduction histidine kinase (bacteriophytochrome)